MRRRRATVQVAGPITCQAFVVGSHEADWVPPSLQVQLQCDSAGHAHERTRMRRNRDGAWQATRADARFASFRPAFSLAPGEERLTWGAVGRRSAVPAA